MKRFLFLFTLILPMQLFAPEFNSVVLLEQSGINPYEALYEATAFVETSKNSLCVNIEEQAYGEVQIRECKLEDFNRSTGKHYTLQDCLKPSISREIFMWHCSKYGPTELEQIACRWNGRGPKTKIYWKKIKRQLN